MLVSFVRSSTRATYSFGATTFTRRFSLESRIGETWKYQDTLPLLPLPTIKETCERYKTFLTPLLNEDEIAREHEIIAKFESSAIAEDLQEQLKNIHARSDNWLEGFWTDMYLKIREPLPIHTNPFFILRKFEFTNANETAANLAFSFFKFNKLVRDRQLTCDMEGQTPLDMTQYIKLFGCTRYPKQDKDTISSNRYSRHIIVMRKGHFFSMHMENEHEHLLQPDEIRQRLDRICEIAESLSEEDAGVGVFTCSERNQWHRFYSQLKRLSTNNEKNLNLLSGAMFVLNLDEGHVDPISEESSKIFLHNQGHNRWFDKLQLIVSENSVAGFNMEHTPVDGHTLVRLATDLYNDVTGTSKIVINDNYLVSGSEKTCPLPVLLEWDLTDSLRAGIDTVKGEFSQLVNSTNTLPLSSSVGKRLIKNAGVSPDAFIQMAIQLAYFRLTNTFASTYESAMTKQFLHGRTETIRSVSNESVQYCKQFDTNQLANSGALLHKAAQRHVETSRNAKNGSGCDRHLFGLFNLAKMEKLNHNDFHLPGIFTSECYSRYCSNIISTSNCGSEAVELFGFGPVHPEGLGIGYVIRNDSTQFNVSSFQRLVKSFSQRLEEALKMQLLAAEEYKNQKS